ncbi:hypothetical protein KI387_010776, partial [Taxus chinensis]
LNPKKKGTMASYGRRLLLVLVALLCLCSLQETCAKKKKKSSWQTLSGKAPLVIARGGLSGFFPDQTKVAYHVAINNSLFDAIMFCDLQLTKDKQGICRTDIKLENSTNIKWVFPNTTNSYIVNGKNISAYFSIDFTTDELFNNVTAIQSFPSRTGVFDGIYQLLSPLQLSEYQPISIWLNIQYSKFYDEHNLSMPLYVRSLSRRMALDYISSTEVGFLRDIKPKFRRSKTLLILRFLNKEDIEPSTNETYGSIIRNLTFVKTFAAGILVPKSYIWPLGTDQYLQTPTNLVEVAHTAGLEIFASDFANDEYDMSYNYSNDPIKEYLQFVDNGNFAVDGVLTDFSVTASEAIACYAHKNLNISSRAGNPLIISHNGASGDYPGCTDTAYEAAIRDGADYIDCSVQITKDGIPFCRESPDLFVGTTITSNSAFYPSRMTKVPAIQRNQGIFTFDLTWKEIQNLTVQTVSPYVEHYQLSRNPAQASVGKYMNLTSFLEFAKRQADINVIINIENARAIISDRNLDVTNATLSALNMSGYDKIADRIRIQSDDSAVLLQFKQRTKFKLIYKVDENNMPISNAAIGEIKTLSETVSLSRGVIFPLAEDFFLSQASNVVSRFHLHNISVFVYTLKNEFPSLAFDFQADPTMEIDSFVQVAKVDGLITEFPATVTSYFGNACRQPRTKIDYSMFLVVPGLAVSIIPPENLSPVGAPAPSLSLVIDPPLPPLNNASTPEPATVSAPEPASGPPSPVSESSRPNCAYH